MFGRLPDRMKLQGFLIRTGFFIPITITPDTKECND